MRPRIALVRAACVAAALVTAIALAPAAAAAPTPTGVVAGVVTGADGRPLQGVVVTMSRYFQAGAFPPVITPYASDVTGRTGAYRLRVASDEDQGALLLQFRAGGATGGTSPTGYADRCYGGGSDCLWSAKPGTAFTIVPGRTRSGVDVTLKRAGELRARVVDAQGRGVGGVPVTFAVGSPVLSDTPENYEPPAATAVTDVDGNVRLRQLPAESGGVCVGSYDGNGPAGTPAPGGYTARCFPNVVPVSGRVSTPTFVVAGRGAFTGTVVDTAGRPVAGATVFDYTDAIDNLVRFRTTTATDGTFRLPVDAGRRYWCAGADGYDYTCADTPATVRPYQDTALGTIVLRRQST